MLKEISPHVVRVFLYIRDSKRWVTTREIAEGARVSDSTARHRTSDLFKLGLLERAYDLYPGYQYKLTAGYKQHELTKRILDAQKIFGL